MIRRSRLNQRRTGALIGRRCIARHGKVKRYVHTMFMFLGQDWDWLNRFVLLCIGYAVYCSWSLPACASGLCLPACHAGRGRGASRPYQRCAARFGGWPRLRWMRRCRMWRRTMHATWPIAGISAIPPPGGRGLMDRARGQTGFCQLAENIARGQRDIPTVMGIWLRSTGHRAKPVGPGPNPCGAWPRAGAILGAGLWRAVLIAGSVQLHYLCHLTAGGYDARHRPADLPCRLPAPPLF